MKHAADRICIDAPTQEDWPIIHRVSPLHIKAGITVSLFGKGFNQSLPLQISIDDISVEHFTIVSDSEITFEVPEQPFFEISYLSLNAMRSTLILKNEKGHSAVKQNYLSYDHRNTLFTVPIIYVCILVVSLYFTALFARHMFKKCK